MRDGKNQFKKTVLAGCLALLATLGISLAQAQVPEKINYEGVLNNASGQPVTATLPMVLQLYTTATGGTPIYTESQSVAVAAGVFTVTIGAVTPLTVPFDVPYFLGVTVGTDPEMSPRIALLSSPYARRSAVANGVADGAVSQSKLSATGASSGKILGTDGSNLVWQNAVGGGTVTSITAGAGLSGGTITTSGTFSLSSSQLLPVSTCSAGQVPKWSGSAWACAADNGGGSVTSITAGNGLTGGVITDIGTIGLDPGSTLLTRNYYKSGGNAFGTTAILGTTDNNALELRVNGARVMRYEADNVIGGYSGNSASLASTVSGGGNAATNCWDSIARTETKSCANVAVKNSTVGGGYGNTALGGSSTVSGGKENTASDEGAAVLSGIRQAATRMGSLVAGGLGNTSSGYASSVGGGSGNTASAFYASVMGGAVNQATGENSTVSGGRYNTASGISATVPGGEFNLAIGPNTYAAGSNAQAGHANSFVWNGYSSVNTSQGAGRVHFFSPNGLSVHLDNTNGCAPGGQAQCWVYVNNGTQLIATSSGAYLSNAGQWTNSSDRNLKTDIQSIDTQDVLARVVDMPITQWRYRTEDVSSAHIGPMAQDFYAAFKLGQNDDKVIGTVDETGVALAAIQGLNKKLEDKDAAVRTLVAEKDKQIAQQFAHIAQLMDATEALRSEVAALRSNQAELAMLQVAMKQLLRERKGMSPTRFATTD